MADPGVRFMRKFAWRVLYPIILLEVLNFLDRVNVSFASLQMKGALGIAPREYGLSVALFSIGYVIFQVPSIWILKRFGMRRWLTATVAIWGAITLATAAIATPIQFYVLRFLLGLAEAGFAAGVVYYITLFTPQRFRAQAMAATMAAVPLSVVLGGPLTGWLLSHPMGALPGWRWMFLIEGVPALALAAVTPFWFADHPDAASWIEDAERAWLASAMETETSSSTRGALVTPLAVVSSLRVWLAALLYFCLINAANSIVFWLPQVVKPIIGGDDFKVGLVSALPWIGIAAGMILNARSSDRSGERTWHIAAAAAVAAVGIAGAVLVRSPLGALGLLILGGTALGAAQGVFWAVPTEFLDRKVVATGIAFISVVSALLLPVFPYLVGVLRETTGSYRTPVLFLAASLFLAAGLMLAIARLRRRSAAASVVSPTISDSRGSIP